MDWTTIAQVFTVGATIQFWIASIFVGFLGYYLVRLIIINKKKYNEIDNYRKSVMNSVQMEYNKIGTMKPEELDTWLDEIFTSCLKLSIAGHYTPKDPINGETVYAYAIKSLITYIGKTTEESINFFYGKDYIYRWCELRYNLMSQTGALSKLIDSIHPAEVEEQL